MVFFLFCIVMVVLYFSLFFLNLVRESFWAKFVCSRRMICELLCWSPSWWHCATPASLNSRGGPSSTDSPTLFSFLQMILGSTMSRGTTQQSRLSTNIHCGVDFEGSHINQVLVKINAIFVIRRHTLAALPSTGSSWNKTTLNQSVPLAELHLWQVRNLQFIICSDISVKFEPWNEEAKTQRFISLGRYPFHTGRQHESLPPMMPTGVSVRWDELIFHALIFISKS